jgi:hypothetical protein
MIVMRFREEDPYDADIFVLKSIKFNMSDSQQAVR